MTSTDARARGTHLDDLKCRSTVRCSTSLESLFSEASLDRGQSIVKGDGARAEFHGDLTGNTIDVPTADTAALVRRRQRKSIRRSPGQWMRGPFNPPLVFEKR